MKTATYICNTILRLLHTWEPRQLVDELAATRHAFGYMGPTGPVPAPALQPNQPSPPKTTRKTTNEEHTPESNNPEGTTWNLTLPATIIQL